MKTCNICKHNLADSIFEWNSKKHKCCKPCVNRSSKWQVDNWPQVCVKFSKIADHNKMRLWNEDEYVTVEFLLAQYDKQEGYCFYRHPEGPLKMQTRCRQASDGLTIERLNNDLPHTKENCVLSCFDCNVRRRNAFKEPLLLC